MLVMSLLLLISMLAIVFVVCNSHDKIVENEELREENTKYKEFIKKNNLEAQMSELQPP